MSNEKAPPTPSDLTNLLDYARKVEKTGGLAVPSEDQGPVLTEQIIERVDQFETLSEYAATNPAAEAPGYLSEPEPLDTAGSNQLSDSDSSLFPTTESVTENVNDTANDGTNQSQDFQISESDGRSGFSQIPENAVKVEKTGFELRESGDDLSQLGQAKTSSKISIDGTEGTVDETGREPVGETTSAMPENSAFLVSDTLPPIDHLTLATPTSAPISFEPQVSESASPPLENSQTHSSTGKTFSSPTTHPPQTGAISQHFKSAEAGQFEKGASRAGAHVTSGASVPASYPFSVYIDGKLTPEEREKLLDLLSTQKFGISELDLELQLSSGKVLIPRISEYAAILIVQTMRDSEATLYMAPTESSDSLTLIADQNTHSRRSYDSSLERSIHEIEIFVDSNHSLAVGESLGELLLVSAAIKSEAVEIQQSTVFMDTLERLKSELRLKARAKGARAVVGFQITIDRLSLPSLYRVTASGTPITSD